MYIEARLITQKYALLLANSNAKIQQKFRSSKLIFQKNARNIWLCHEKAVTLRVRSRDDVQNDM